jgi:hypothetical protein
VIYLNCRPVVLPCTVPTQFSIPWIGSLYRIPVDGFPPRVGGTRQAGKKESGTIGKTVPRLHLGLTGD